MQKSLHCVYVIVGKGWQTSTYTGSYQTSTVLQRIQGGGRREGGRAGVACVAAYYRVGGRPRRSFEQSQERRWGARVEEEHDPGCNRCKINIFIDLVPYECYFILKYHGNIIFY